MANSIRLLDLVLFLPGVGGEGGRGGGLWRLVASSRWMMVLDGAGGRADGDTFTEPPGRFVADAGRAGRPRLRAGF
jgi:hypothetical protein